MCKRSSFRKYQSLCSADPIRKELQSARELIYPTDRSLLQPQRGEEAKRVIGVQRKTPAARSLHAY